MGELAIQHKFCTDENVPLYGIIKLQRVCMQQYIVVVLFGFNIMPHVIATPVATTIINEALSL